MGQTIHLQLPDEVFQTLKDEAEKRGQVPENLAAELLVHAMGNSSEDPLESFFGTFDSHGLDWVDNHDQYLAAGKIRNGD